MTKALDGTDVPRDPPRRREQDEDQDDLITVAVHPT